MTPRRIHAALVAAFASGLLVAPLLRVVVPQVLAASGAPARLVVEPSSQGGLIRLKFTNTTHNSVRYDDDGSGMGIGHLDWQLRRGGKPIEGRRTGRLPFLTVADVRVANPGDSADIDLNLRAAYRNLPSGDYDLLLEYSVSEQEGREELGLTPLQFSLTLPITVK